MNVCYDSEMEKFASDIEDLKYTAPDRGETEILDRIRKKYICTYVIVTLLCVVVPMIAVSPIFVESISSGMIGTVIGLSVCYLFFLVILVAVVNALNDMIHPSYGICHGVIVSKRIKDAGKNKYRYVSVWSEENRQFCKDIPFNKFGKRSFDSVKTGEEVVIYHITRKRFNADLKEVFYGIK